MACLAGLSWSGRPGPSPPLLRLSPTVPMGEAGPTHTSMFLPRVSDAAAALPTDWFTGIHYSHMGLVTASILVVILSSEFMKSIFKNCNECRCFYVD